MIRKTLFSTLAILGLTTGGFAASQPKSSIGVVNFSTCMTESKFGKQEQSSFDSLKTQMTSLLQDTEKQINDIASKFNDTEYMDGLSPDAEEEMKNRYQTLNEEMGRYQNQYYQVMNQAQMKVIQSIGSMIQTASEKVAKEKKFSMMLNKEACFAFDPAFDVTNLVIAEMDKQFELDNAKVVDNQAPEKK